MVRSSFAVNTYNLQLNFLNSLVYHSDKYRSRYLLNRYLFFFKNFFKTSQLRINSNLFININFFYLSSKNKFYLLVYLYKRFWKKNSKRKFINIFKYNFKNIKLFLKKILFLNLLNFINFNVNLNKRLYFLNLYIRFYLNKFYFFSLIKKNFLFTSIKKQYRHLYNKFKIFNFFKWKFLKRFSSIKNTYIDLFFLNRNFLISFYNYFFNKFWSIGLFLKLLKLKYKIKNQIKYIKAFFFKVKLNFTKYIILFLNKISIRFDLFLKNLLFLIENLNKKIYKKKFLKLHKIIIKLKFKIFEKKNKKKPRKKKYIIKKLKTYTF